jgi:Domain of unknown function (DUF4291)
VAQQGAVKIPTALYREQSRSWPSSGQHILAHFDDTSVIVYQAYRPSIGRFAIENQRFGGPDFSLGRMSWVKPNFLWMMYRSGWGTKEGQEITLGLRLRIAFFEAILEQAVPSAFEERLFKSHAEWQEAVAASEVRLQWDPDHSPSGAKLERRAIQLGLRGEMLRRLAQTELLEVIDLTAFVETQRRLVAPSAEEHLRTPCERPYLPSSEAARLRVQADAHDA